MAARSSAEQRIKAAQDKFQQYMEAEQDIRNRSLDDLRFLAASPDDKEWQWGEYAIQQRARDKRPALVVNRLDQFVLHIANGMRQNRVSARVFPVDDKADVDTAEVRQGLLRHTEYISNAQIAYHTAAFYAIAMGFGYFRLNTEYCHPMTFEQEIKIERVENPFNVLLGAHSMPDGSDAEDAFLFTDYTKEQYKALFGESELGSLNDWRTAGATYPAGWLEDESVRVAEYFYTDWEHEKLVRLADGSIHLLSKLPEGQKQYIENERDTRIPTVRWCKFNAMEILEETDWVIPQIPIIKVTGREMNVDGKRMLRGIVRNMKDAQRQYNFMLSKQTEVVDSSTGNLVLYEGQEEGHEEEIRNINKGQPIRVKPTSLDGKTLPLPQRLAPNMSIPAMSEARQMAGDDLKTLVSIYDAALGARSNETSGRAIANRQQQSETANFDFQDNLTISISHSARMIVNMQTEIYDTPRVVRIIGEDDAHKIVKINQEFREKPESEAKTYDFSVGKYDVVCTAGPSFATKRKEAAEQLVQLAGVDEGLMQTAPDIVYKALDVPYAQEIAERRKKALPPGLADDEAAPVPPEAQQKLAQMGQMVEALTQQLNQAKDALAMKQPEIESKERIEMAKLAHADKELQVRLIENQLKLDSQEAIAALKAEVDAIKAGMQLDAQAAAREANAAAETIGA